VFQVHGTDAAGKVIIRRQLKRRYVLAFFMRLTPYPLLGAMLWALMLISGVHATMAGVLLAMAIRLGNSQLEGRGRHHASSPLHRLGGHLLRGLPFSCCPSSGLPMRVSRYGD
jgi:Na+/H+ antiporter NhaA